MLAILGVVIERVVRLGRRGAPARAAPPVLSRGHGLGLDDLERWGVGQHDRLGVDTGAFSATQLALRDLAEQGVDRGEQLLRRPVGVDVTGQALSP